MQQTTRLHPLLTAAAISITVFSAVGVASLTGLISPSIGSSVEPEPLAATPAVVEAPKVVAKPAPQVRQAPRPVVALPKNLATVQAVREVKQAGEHTAMGPIAGGVAGAVLGSQVGGGSGKKIMTVVGALGGAMAGRHIEEQVRATTRWEIDVRHDSGAFETVSSEAAPPYGAGDRVRVVDGRLQPV